MEGEKRQKKKQKHQDASSDGRGEEAETKGGTREGGEEEAGMPGPRASSDSHQASAMLAALERESGWYRRWATPMLSHQKSDAASTCFGFWLKEEEASFPPCQGGEMFWVSVSLALTGPSWVSERPSASGEGVVPSPPSSPQPYHSLRLNPTSSEDFERSRWLRNLKRLRGLYVKEMTSYLASFMEGKFGGI